MALKKPNYKFSIYFCTIAAILVVVVFLSFISNYKKYQSEIRVLFVIRNEKLSQDSERIVENFLEFTKYLSFYDRFLEEGKFPEIFPGKSKDEKKKLWPGVVSAARVSGSQTVQITAWANTEDLAKTYSRQAVLTLVNFSSKYYNLRDDVELRIVEGPIIAPYYQNFAPLIILALAVGCILALLINIFVDKVIGSTGKLFFQPKKDYSIKLESDESIIQPEAKTEIQAVKKYQAPANLPIISEEEIVAEIPEKLAKPKNYSEPTEEEIKRRLNQLLKGGM